MHTGLGALSYAAELVECADTSSVQKEKTSCGGAMRSHDDDELTVHVDDASSDSSDETIELSPQVTLRGSVAGHIGPPAMATSSCYDLSLAASGPSMTVTSRWVDQQRERSPPVRSAFSVEKRKMLRLTESIADSTLPKLYISLTLLVFQ